MASRQGRQMTSFLAFSSRAVRRIPESTSLSARRTRHPRRRSVSRKLAAEGSATTARISLSRLSFKAAKYAVSNSVPIIGGFLGSGFDLVVAGSVLIKNSVGSCGIILLALVVLPPLIQLVVCNLFMRLSAAVVEPIGEPGFSGVLASLGGAVNYFTAGLLAVGFMYFITMLLLVCSSNTLF